jgi:hypothetical protein
MALIKRSEIRKASSTTRIVKEAASVLVSEAKSTEISKFDIFLSHSSKDAKEVLEVKRFLESLNHSVYVDWDTDGHLNRAKVTADTAKHLRKRIRQSRCLMVYTTTNAVHSSRWVPWELGYADGVNGRVAVLPVQDDTQSEMEFHGSEYLSLYPYVDEATVSGTSKSSLWVGWSTNTYVIFSEWLAGENPTRRQ